MDINDVGSFIMLGVIGVIAVFGVVGVVLSFWYLGRAGYHKD